jgi:antitoxin VapB
MDQQVITMDDEAARLANELAELTGETVEAAVVRAVRERLEREKEVRKKVADIMAIAAEIRAHVEPGTTSDHSWLYDEDGLPA